MSGLVFFTADDGVHGRELWATDGTPSGTRMVRDIVPGSASSAPHSLARLDDTRAIFVADGDIWTSDGTAAGTIRLDGFADGALVPSGITELTQIAPGKVLFSATAPGLGQELWITDGTAEGTRLVRDIFPGANAETGEPFSSAPSQITAVAGGRAVFFATTAEHGRELWGTDGTADGTRLLADTEPGSESGAVGAIRTMPNGKALFAPRTAEHGREPWVSDGTVSGTFKLADIRPGPTDSFLVQQQPLPDGRYGFSAMHEPDWDRSDNWVTDGTVTNTMPMTEQPGIGWQRLSVPDMPNNETEIGFFLNPVREAVTDPAFRLAGMLGDGRMLFPGDTFERYVHVDDEGTSSLRVRTAGSQLWVTDGTVEGTELFFPIERSPEGPAVHFNPGGFFALGDGQLAFTAWSESTARGELWVASPDGSVTQLTEGVGAIRTLDYGFMPYPDNVWHFGLESRRDGHVRDLWMTDGTPAGTRVVVENIDFFWGADDLMSLPDGRWLFELEIDGWEDESAIFLADATGRNVSFVTDEVPIGPLRRGTATSDGLVVFSQRTSEEGAEPWVLNVNTGTLQLLGDLRAGTAGSTPRDFLTLADPGPTVLDVTWLSTEGEDTQVGLPEIIATPIAPEATVIVTGLPEGLALQPDGRTVAGTLEAPPGNYTVGVTVVQEDGRQEALSFDWSVIDTGLLRLNSDKGWTRETEDGPILSKPGSVITVGHKDGAEALFRIEEGSAKIENGKLTLDGALHSVLEALDKPLMLGGFEVEMATLKVSEFEDKGAEESLRLAGGLVEMAFSQLDIRPEALVLGTDLGFSGEFAAFSTSGAPLSVHLGPETISFGPGLVGTGRWTPPAKPFAIPGTSTMTLKFENLGIFYDLASDDLFLNGKASLAWGGPVAAQYSFLQPGRQSGLVLDLAGDTPDDVSYALGDKYLRLGFDGAGKFDWDIVGEIVYTGKGPGVLPAGFPKLTELKLELKTPDSEFKGSLKAELPFMFYDVELQAELGAKWAPEVAIDSFAFGIDNLNIAIGTTPLFLQGGKLGAEGLAGREPGEGATYKAEMLVSLGPTYDNLPTPIKGKLTGEVAPKKMQLGFEMDSQVGYFLPSVVEQFAGPLINRLGVDPDKVTEFELAKLEGTAAVDFGNPSFTASLQASLIGGLYTGVSQVALFAHGGAPAVTASSSGTLAFPKPMPLVGGRGLSGNTALQYIHDDDPTNDFVAAWTVINLPGGRFTGEVGAGVRLGFDGSVSILGRKGVDLVGSWELAPEQDIVILSAYWETPSDDARLELILPGNVVLTEADFADRDDIALVEDLNDPTSRHVAIAEPVAGIWDLRLADETGLGEIRLEASEMLPTPVARIAAVELDESLTATVTLTGPEALAAPVSLFLSPEQGASAGLGLVSLGTLAPGESLTTVQDFAALEPGEWWLHARTEADGHIPGLDMFATPILVEGAADLGVTIREGMHRETGSRTVTVEVANAGERASGQGSLRVDVGEALLGGAAVAGFAPFAAADARLDLPSLAPGQSQSFGFVLPTDAPAGAVIRLTAEASAWDANPADNSLVYVLSGGGALGGELLARDGTPMAGTELALRLADGSALGATSDAGGRFLFEAADLTDAVLHGPTWVAADGPRITTGSALEALRMAVGLQPSWGPAVAEDFLAADVNGDGRVTTADALEILRTAVGLPSDHAPRWIFVETGQDFGEVTRTSVPQDIAPDFAALADPGDVSLTGLLTGHLQAWT